MRIHFKLNYGILALFVCTSFITHGQQSIENLPDQVSKGKWMISHDLFSLAYYNEKNKSYDGDGNRTGSDKTSKFYAAFSLVSPNWSNLNLGAGKTRRYDENGAEMEVVKNSNWSVGLNPSIGYFIRDRLFLGGRAQLYFSGDQTTYTTSSGFQEYDYKYTTIGIGPELRYYFGKFVNRQLFHFGIATNLIYRINRQTSTTFSNVSNTTTKSTYSVNQPEFRAEPYFGSSWFCGKHWIFTGMLFLSSTNSNYKLRITDSNGPGKTNTKMMRMDMGVKAGINYTF